MNDPSISGDEKLFYTIGDVANMVGLKTYVLRYWETAFKALNPQKSTSGQRVYRKKDIEAVLTIKRLLYDEKYTIAGAIKKLEETEEGGLDQLDMFLAKQAAHPVAEAPKFTAPPEPVLSGENAVPWNPLLLERARELKALLLSSFEILRKYDLE